MNEFDKKIKIKKEQVAKMKEEVKIKKQKIKQTEAEIKQLEVEKNADSEKIFMKKLSELGVVTTEDRDKLMSKIEDLLLEQELENEQKVAAASNENEIKQNKNFTSTT